MRKLRQNERKIQQTEVRRYLNIAWIRKFNQVILGTSICLMILIILLTALFNLNYIFWPDALLTILFWFFLGVCFAFSFTDDPVDLIKPGITLVGDAVLAVLIFVLSIFPWWSLAFVLPIAYVLSMIMFIGLCMGFFSTAFINCYVFYFWIKYKKRNPELFKLYRIKKIRNILLVAIPCLGIPLLILAIPGVIQIPITIEPQDYKAEIAFWGGYGFNDTDRLNNLNNHEVTLVACCYSNISQTAGKQSFINWMTYYNNSYPNISYYFSVPGSPGAFIWDGNLDNAFNYAKELVAVIQINNLTTVKGLAFDIEAPYFPSIFHQYDFDISPNATRHLNSIQQWYDFFTWMNTNAPELKLRAINYVESAADQLDGDYDLHYIRRYSFMDLETDAFEEYAPMSYRGMYLGTQPYGDPMENPLVSYSDGGHYWIYNQLYFQAKALDSKFGKHDKMGIYLGITNVTCYSADYQQYQNGQPAGYGFDNLVRDALIAKHFGVNIITLFLLTTVIENGYSMGGVFDSYGNDFLDRFNESINGPASTTPFQIWYKPKMSWYMAFGQMDMFYLDKYADLNSLLGIISFSLLFAGNILVAYYGWKKIKNKVLNQYLTNTKNSNKKEKVVSE